MPYTYKGKCAYYGVDGKLQWAGAASATMQINGVSVTDSFPVAKMVAAGTVHGGAAGERTWACTVRVRPIDASGAIATAKSNIKLPNKLDDVLLKDFGIVMIDGDTSGATTTTGKNWTYMGGSINPTEEGYVEVVMNLERYGDDPATATAISGNA